MILLFYLFFWILIIALLWIIVASLVQGKLGRVILASLAGLLLVILGQNAKKK